MSKPYDETGFSAPHPGDATCRNIIDFVRPLVEDFCGKPFHYFKCLEYSTKQTYGNNYKIRVGVDNGSLLHLYVYQPPSGGFQLNSVERARLLSDPLNEPIDTRGHYMNFNRGTSWVREKIFSYQVNQLCYTEDCKGESSSWRIVQRARVQVWVESPMYLQRWITRSRQEFSGSLLGL